MALGTPCFGIYSFLLWLWMKATSRLYTTVVRPHLEYGNVIWSSRYRLDIKEIEKIQRTATKLVPNLRKCITLGKISLTDTPTTTVSHRPSHHRSPANIHRSPKRP